MGPRRSFDGHDAGIQSNSLRIRHGQAGSGNLQTEHLRHEGAVHGWIRQSVRRSSHDEPGVGTRHPPLPIGGQGLGHEDLLTGNSVHLVHAVAGRKDTGCGRLHVLVHRNRPLDPKRHPCFPGQIARWLDAHGEQNEIRRDHLAAAQHHLYPVRPFEPFQGSLHQKRASVARQFLGNDFRQFGIQPKDCIPRPLQNGHRTPKGREGLSHFQTDQSGPDHDRPFGHMVSHGLTNHQPALKAPQSHDAVQIHTRNRRHDGNGPRGHDAGTIG